MRDTNNPLDLNRIGYYVALASVSVAMLWHSEVLLDPTVTTGGAGWSAANLHPLVNIVLGISMVASVACLWIFNRRITAKYFLMLLTPLYMYFAVLMMWSAYQWALGEEVTLARFAWSVSAIGMAIGVALMEGGYESDNNDNSSDS